MALEGEQGAFVVVGWPMDGDGCSLLLCRLIWRRLSLNDRKNARAFSTALLADAEWGNFLKDSINENE